MKQNIWDFWAKHYEGLWVQRVSLKPTREYVAQKVGSMIQEKAQTLLDLGCGTGELIELITQTVSENTGMNASNVTGIDFSEGMLAASMKRNPQARHVHLSAEKLHVLSETYDFITCTHSLPYYKNKPKVLREIHARLNSKGRLIIAFASGNTIYDKIALSFVKLTTGSAQYPSDAAFRAMIAEIFEVEEGHVIRTRFYIPTIAVYTLRRRDENITG